MRWFRALVLRSMLGLIAVVLLFMLLADSFQRVAPVATASEAWGALVLPLIAGFLLGFFLPDAVMSVTWALHWKRIALRVEELDRGHRKQLFWRGISALTTPWSFPPIVARRLDQYITLWVRNLIQTRTNEIWVWRVYALAWYSLREDKEVLDEMRDSLLEAESLTDDAFQVGLALLRELGTDVELAILLARSSISRRLDHLNAQQQALLENAWVLAYANDDTLHEAIRPLMVRRFLAVNRRDATAGRIYIDAFLQGARSREMIDEMARVADVLERVGKNMEFAANLRALAASVQDSGQSSRQDTEDAGEPELLDEQPPDLLDEPAASSLFEDSGQTESEKSELTPSSEAEDDSKRWRDDELLAEDASSGPRMDQEHSIHLNEGTHYEDYRGEEADGLSGSEEERGEGESGWSFDPSEPLQREHGSAGSAGGKGTVFEFASTGVRKAEKKAASEKGGARKEKADQQKSSRLPVPLLIAGVVAAILLVLAGFYMIDGKLPFTSPQGSQNGAATELDEQGQGGTPAGNREIRSQLPYTIQVLAAPDHDRALAELRKLHEKGLNAYWVHSEEEDASWYRLRAGHFDGVSPAKAFGDSLRQAGVIEEFYVADFVPGTIPGELLER